MRKFQKKMAFEFVQTLHQAHDQIKLLIEKKQNIQVMDLLEQCQEGAIELGNFIEQFEGEELPIIQRLEEYCENTYQLHEKIGSGEELNSGKVYKILRKQMIQIENGIKNEVKEQMEVVFLPYKASMWDSLESVWIAAKEDPNCQAYVIPIPYYDKDSEGNLKEEHWEGDQYPEYVPIFRYEDYDFEQRHPDMIFIHNPYDNCNYVTSVHPNFYSKNLKKFTDKLVYIPYFILDEISPNDQEAIERMEHFCTVPAVVNADKVIVQSEEMRQVYIKVMSKVAGELSRSYWEKKILGLGSPKVDKILNTRKEDLEIPEEWMKIIQKPDGRWKKIILYNTSVGALLTNGEEMVNKIENVLQVFKKQSEDVALLWRPHPLMESTIKSMRENLLEHYEIIVDKYKKDGWGIFDDSADLDRAIMISDAYYGDTSSLVQLFQRMEKPILIQNIEVKEVV